MPSEDPAKKRARFADDEGKEMEEVFEEEDDGEDEDEEEEELPPYTVIANDVMTVKLITGKGDAADGRSFQPSYTHQVFRVKATDDADPIHEEMIIGYENPTVEISYSSNTLKPFVDFKSDETVDMKLLKQNNLTRTNVHNCIAKFVPCDYANKISAVEEDAASDFTPLGTLVHSEPGDDGETLEIHHFVADSPQATTFVQRLQTFVIWTIETGSFVQVPDAAWNIFTLYSKKMEGARAVYCIVGFITAYKYWVYDKYSHSVDKFRLRVSQVVVLPPFQRKGYGGKMLRAVYKHARSDDRILDVSVEDPSPDFQALRDVVDSMMIKEGADWGKLTSDGMVASEIALKYKITKMQVSRLATTAQFVKLGLTDPGADPEAGSGGAKALRLKLKQRLFKQCLCEPRGIGLVEDLGDAGGEGGGGKGKKKRAAPEPEEAAKSDAEAEAEKMVKVWGEGGDPETRKELLKEMYKALYRAHAATACKLAKC